MGASLCFVFLLFWFLLSSNRAFVAREPLVWKWRKKVPIRTGENLMKRCAFVES